MRQRIILYATIFFVCIGLVFFYLQFRIAQNNSLYSIINSVLIVISVALTFDTLIKLRSGGKNFRPYNIAIIGFPQSGKTTLIVSLFQEIFNRKLSGVRASLKGNSTIERLNDQISRKESGLPVGPTTDQTMFAYRTNIETNGLFFKREYRAEFGDYPGELSEELSNNEYFEKLKKTEFFKWCVEADAYIFIIDVGKFLATYDRPAYIASSSKAIRESWQHFMDYNELIQGKIRKRPVILVFNKMDTFQTYNNSQSAGISQSEQIERIKLIAFSTEKTPPVTHIEHDEYDFACKILKMDFEGIISYLRSECNEFHILFTSSFGTIDGKLAGVHDIIRFVFPSGIIQ